MSRDLVSLISNLKEREALAVADERLAFGEDPLAILEDAKIAMQLVGRRFAEGSYYIPDLIFSGRILQRIADRVKPRLAAAASGEAKGRIVIGSVAGDIHDIGKNLVAFFLEIHGFQVHDLGVDVPAARFAEKALEIDAQVIALSGFLTSIFNSMKSTVDAIREAGLRDRVKIMVGGGVVDEEIRAFCGADAYGADAMAAVKLAKQWIGGGNA